MSILKENPQNSLNDRVGREKFSNFFIQSHQKKLCKLANIIFKQFVLNESFYRER